MLLMKLREKALELIKNTNMGYECLAIVVQWLSHVWLWDPVGYSTPGPSVLHYILEFAQIHVHWFGEAI